MRTDDEDFLAEQAGTTTGDRLVATVWRGSQDPLEVPVTAWDLDWDAGRQVQGQTTLTIADVDGLLAPWGFGDLLAPGGSLMRLAWVSGRTGLRLPLGAWRIRGARPVEQWRVYRSGSALVRVPGGGQVTVRADEVTSAAKLARLDAVPGPTRGMCLAEVEHLLDGIMAVTANGVVDVPVPALTYGEDRMDAVEQVLAVLGAVHRMAPDGSLEVLTPQSVPVLTLAGGDSGTLIDVTRELSDDGVFNAVTSRGQTAAGAPLVARAVITGGPLEFGGPFGRVPAFHDSTSATAQAVQADAAAALAGQTAGAEAVLPVDCVTNPAVQLHDRVVIAAPTLVSDEPLAGRVVAMRMASAGSGESVTPAKRMQLSVAVTAESLEAVAARVSRARR